MRGLKIPQQYFVLKGLGGGGLCARGGIFAGHYGICTYVSDLESCMFHSYKVVCTCVCYTYWIVYMCVCGSRAMVKQNSLNKV